MPPGMTLEQMLRVMAADEPTDQGVMMGEAPTEVQVVIQSDAKPSKRNRSEN